MNSCLQRFAGDSRVVLFQLPRGTDAIHHEVELGVVIGEGGSSIPEADVMKHVAGYTLALDMTNRTKQNELKKKGKWTAGLPSAVVRQDGLMESCTCPT